MACIFISPELAVLSIFLAFCQNLQDCWNLDKTRQIYNKQSKRVIEEGLSSFSFYKKHCETIIF